MHCADYPAVPVFRWDTTWASVAEAARNYWAVTLTLFNIFVCFFVVCQYRCVGLIAADYTRLLLTKVSTALLV